MSDTPDDVIRAQARQTAGQRGKARLAQMWQRAEAAAAAEADQPSAEDAFRALLDERPERSAAYTDRLLEVPDPPPAA